MVGFFAGTHGEGESGVTTGKFGGFLSTLADWSSWEG